MEDNFTLCQGVSVGGAENCGPVATFRGII